MIGLFVLRRLGSGFLVLIGVSVLIFALARVMPGDPARLALGSSATSEQVEALRLQLGLNRSIPVQYLGFVTRAVRGDFGISLYSSRRVSTDIAETFPATLELVIVSTLLVGVLGVVLGVLAAMRRGTWTDKALQLVAVLGAVTPTFVWAVLLMLLFGFWLGWLPIAGRLSEWLLPPPHVTGLFIIDALLAGEWMLAGDALRHVVLPAVALSLPALGQTARLTRVNMIEVQRAPHIELMRAFGVPERSISFKYALRPASIPTLTIIGLEFVALFGNAFLVESVFMWPGMARYGVQTILNKDLNGLMATVMVMTILFVVVNTVTDIVIAYVNPRIQGTDAV